MVSLQIQGTAALVFGTNAPHSRDLIKNACDANGWTKVVNRPPSKSHALDAAVREVAKPLFRDDDSSLSVRALTQDLAFEAVRIQRGQKRNTALHIFSAQLDGAEKVALLDCHADLDAGVTLASVQLQYDTHRNNLSAGQVQTAVQGVVRMLGGVALGGRNVYYIPHASVNKWQQWRDAAQLWRYHNFPLEAAQDPATVEHIISQLNVEVSETSQRVQSAVESGDLTPKAAKALAKASRAVIDKIKSYEAALGQQLDWMRGPLEAAQSALAVSSLLSASV
jgi:hypothetical protein